MLAQIQAATLLGARGRPVTVEVHVANGLPGFSIVGLPDEACREARDRVRAAVLSSGESWPQQRITVNLAPSTLRKGGSGLDLAIAVGMLVAMGRVPADATAGLAFVGELGLDGTVRRIPGVLPLVAALGSTDVVVPADCVVEARLISKGNVRGAARLVDVAAALRGTGPWPDIGAGPPPPPDDVVPDLADVRGQPLARFALEVAATGRHHLLLTGPPGSGKSMLARRLPALLPDLAPDVALEVTMAHSAAGLPLPNGLLRRPPLRAPHHTASVVAIVGGGTSALRPGEISLAHGGVLILDELGEFDANVLDAMREPLEEGVVRVVRARATAELPARFLLVATTNPCPCGNSTRPGACTCTASARGKYVRRLSGPLLDRFDLRVTVERPPTDEVLGGPPGETTATVLERVEAARSYMAARSAFVNADIPGHLLDELAPLTPAARDALHRALDDGRLSARGLHRIRRVARTVADLCASEVVDDFAVMTALNLRTDPLAIAREVAA